jgi:hypothetical protein
VESQVLQAMVEWIQVVWDNWLGEITSATGAVLVIGNDSDGGNAGQFAKLGGIMSMDGGRSKEDMPLQCSWGLQHEDWCAAHKLA